MKLDLTMDILSIIKWWVETSHRVYWDYNGHTTMMMLLETGAAMIMSHGQNMKNRSSTESELVCIDDVLSTILGGNYFSEAQGYTVEHNSILQDNKSMILLTTNGMFSSPRTTKHTWRKFLLVKDNINQGDLEVQ